ncbi:MAG: GNAT family N-acetyltransferase [Pseudomonadota bacterium]
MPSETTTTVRALAETDRLAWDLLWQGYLAFYETSLPVDQTALTWSRLMDPAEAVFGLVAEVKGQVRGIAHALPHSSTWARVGYLYLEDLFVAPEVRGLGLGRQLIEALYAIADEREIARVYWATKHDNPARRLYDQLATESGFVQYRAARLL